MCPYTGFFGFSAIPFTMWPPYPRVELLISQLFGFCGLGQTVENQISLPTIKVGKRTGGSLVKHFFFTGPNLL